MVHCFSSFQLIAGSGTFFSRGLLIAKAGSTFKLYGSRDYKLFCEEVKVPENPFSSAAGLRKHTRKFLMYFLKLFSFEKDMINTIG